MLRMELPGKSKGRASMYAVREDMAVAEVMEEDAEDRTGWRWKMKSAVATLDGRSRKKKTYISSTTL